MMECRVANAARHVRVEKKYNGIIGGDTRQTVCMKAKQLLQTGIIWTAKLAKNISIYKYF